MKSAQLKFNSSSIADKLFKFYAAKQTQKLIEYASAEIVVIGNRIKDYSGGHNMQRTMNLLDSLCWGVSYNGKLEGSGFYQEQQASKLSFLHEFSPDKESRPVGGHVLAANFIRQMGNLKYNGWRVFFAILAPYWGYWEKGFTMNTGQNTSWNESGSIGNNGFFRWAVMTEQYDRISSDLKPAKMSFKVTVDTSMKGANRDRGSAKGGRYKKYPRGDGKGLYDY